MSFIYFKNDLFNFIVAHTHTLYVYKCNMLNSLNVVHVHMHLSLTTEDWIAYQGTSPWSRPILLSRVINCLEVFI